MSKLAAIDNTKNDEAVTMCEELLARLKSGESVAFGFVEVKRGGVVSTAYSHSDVYHLLNSGAATLAHRLASNTG